MKISRLLVEISLASGAIMLAGCHGSSDSPPLKADLSAQDSLATATPIKHLVVIFDENRSFDHYFATYPYALNPAGEPIFKGAIETSSINGLSGALLNANPNFSNSSNGMNASNPFRIDRTQASTWGENHAYTAEQQAYHNGAADLFPLYTGNGKAGSPGAFGTRALVMGYFDGNTVTALWNYAQHFAMSDDAYTDTYGPSTPGALHLVSGQTNGMMIVKTSAAPSTLKQSSYYISDGQDGYTMINDVDPGYDNCSSKTDQVMMRGRNIGDLLNARNISWGGFMGGFDLSKTNSNGTTGCKRSTLAVINNAETPDYIPHHNWFQYFASTANPNHARPSATAAVGSSFQVDGKTPEPANHEYDIDDFFEAVKSGNFPSVSFLKAPAAEDGHPIYSDPLDEQRFLVRTINFLMQQPDWKNTAIIVTYDDSDGWYDHAYASPTHGSFDAIDQVNGDGICGVSGSLPLGVAGAPVNGRCGPGTRIPFLMISPYAKANYVSHTPITHSSVVRFIEDNWLGSTRLGGGAFDASAGDLRDMLNLSGSSSTAALYLDPNLGTELSSPPSN